MRILIVGLIIFTCFISNCCNVSVENFTSKPILLLDSFRIPNSTIRAIFPLNDNEVWFAGSNGRFGYTKNGGRNWFVDSIKIDSSNLDFRSLSITPNGYIYLVSVASPAIVLRTHKDSLNWEICFEDSSKDAFLDMILFKDNNHGFILSDPKENCFNLYFTKDAGSNWNKTPCAYIPQTLENEAPFAASNSNACWQSNTIYFLTGGIHGSRVFYSADNGQNWKTSNLPIINGGKMTGGFSLDFYSSKTGLAVGGNWDSVLQKSQNICITKDGGITWNTLPYELPYISCVNWLPNSNSRELFLLSGRAKQGPSGMYIINLQNDSIWQFKNTNYLTSVFSSDSIAWLGGRNKIARLKLNR